MLGPLLALAVCGGWIWLFADGFAGMRFDLPSKGQHLAFGLGILFVIVMIFGVQTSAIIASVVVLQEVGHAVAARSLGIKSVQPRIMPLFATPATWSIAPISGVPTTIIGLAGPGTLAVTALMALSLFGPIALTNIALSSLLLLFYIVAAGYGLLCLVPVVPFTGGRIIAQLGKRFAMIVGTITILGFIAITALQYSPISLAIPIIGVIGLGRIIDKDQPDPEIAMADKITILSAYGLIAYILTMCARPLFSAII